MVCPERIIVLSGKRKSGKDFLATLLQQKITEEKCTILRLSHPLKSQYSMEHGLELGKLLDSSDYKENYRADMIKWGEERRKQDPAFFIKAIASEPGAEKPIWIISDARRESDMDCLNKMFSDAILALRIEASDDIRQSRGWIFTEGVDDAESECGLDDYNSFHHLVNNDGNLDQLNEIVDNILHQHNIL